MTVAVPTLLVGLVLLAVAADQFVVGAARLARSLRVPAVVVGVVVVGFGTSLPEALVSALAAGRGEMAVAVGNVVGSNVANLSLLLGVGAVVVPLAVTSTIVRREIPLLLAATVLLTVVVQGRTGRVEGLGLLVAMGLIVAVALRGALREREDTLAGETDDLIGDVPAGSGREVLRTVAGLAGTLLASQLVLSGALSIAEEIGLAAGVVGATIVAVGTSLPELVTVVQSARRGEPDLIVGNLVGSNLFNALAVAGLIGVIGDAPVADTAVTTRAVAVMVVVTVVAAAMLVTGRRVTRVEAVGLLVLYAGGVLVLQ